MPVSAAQSTVELWGSSWGWVGGKRGGPPDREPLLWWGCAADGSISAPADWAFGPKPEEEKAVMAEGTVPEVEWLEEDGVLVEGKPEGEGAGTLPGMEIPLGLLTTVPRSSISFADSHKKRFF